MMRDQNRRKERERGVGGGKPRAERADGGCRRKKEQIARKGCEEKRMGDKKLEEIQEGVLKENQGRK